MGETRVFFSVAGCGCPCQNGAAQVRPSLHAVLLSFPGVSDSATLGTAARQAPLSMGFSRQEHRSGLPPPSPGHFPTQGSNLRLLQQQADSLPLRHPGSPSQSAQTLKMVESLH